MINIAKNLFILCLLLHRSVTIGRVLHQSVNNHVHYCHECQEYQVRKPCADEAAGIIEAARISARKGLCDGKLVKTLIADFKACGLETELPCPAKELLPAVAKDKKADGGEVRFILIKEIGKVEIYGLHIDTEQDI